MVCACVSVTACASSGGMVYTPQPFPQPGGRGGTVAVPAPTDPAGPVAANPPAVHPPALTPPAGRTPPLAAPGKGNADGYALSGTALSLRGAPYKNGGITPDGFDCSGFVRYVYQQHGLAMPREVREQYKVGTQISRDDLEPGDLVFYNTLNRPYSHVGIYIGDGRFIHAPRTGAAVRTESMDSAYWSRRWNGARRIATTI